MKKASKPNKRSCRHRRRKLTRAEQIEEAQAIHIWLLAGRSFALDRIATIANRFKNKAEAQEVFHDLAFITLTLASSERFGPIEMWRRFHHHFANRNQYRAFFARLLPIARGIATARLYGNATRHTELARHLEATAAELWDSSLLPPNSEPYVVHLATLYPGVLQEFLPYLFKQMRKSTDPTSTLVRAREILRAVPALGWAYYKHTENLINSSFLKPSFYGSEEQVIKKFIRDLRTQYRKHMENIRSYHEPVSARKGTSKAKTCPH